MYRGSGGIPDACVRTYFNARTVLYMDSLQQEKRVKKLSRLGSKKIIQGVSKEQFKMLLINIVVKYQNIYNPSLKQHILHFRYFFLQIGSILYLLPRLLYKFPISSLIYI